MINFIKNDISIEKDCYYPESCICKYCFHREEDCCKLKYEQAFEDLKECSCFYDKRGQND